MIRAAYSCMNIYVIVGDEYTCTYIIYVTVSCTYVIYVTVSEEYSYTYVTYEIVREENSRIYLHLRNSGRRVIVREECS
jgi:hypothetical protein